LKRKKAWISGVTLLIVLVIALVSASLYRDSQQPETQSTYWPGEDWRTSTPEEQGIDSNVLYPYISKVQSRTGPYSRIDSVLIVKNSYLVTEAYAPYKTKDHHYDLYSATKSVISALVGIATDEGHISGVEAKMMDYFPEYRSETMDPLKETITIRDLLRMSAGFEWPEWENPATEDDPAGEMMRSFEPVKFILDKPLVTKPGEVFNYSTAESWLLSEIITRATGMNTAEYAKLKLFQPLGITNYGWDLLSDGVPANLELTSRDMAKFGGYSAKGMFGQYIVVLPEWDAVAVFQSHLSVRRPDFLAPIYIVQNGLIKAIQSSEPVEPNPKLGELEQELLNYDTSDFGMCGDTYGC